MIEGIVCMVYVHKNNKKYYLNDLDLITGVAWWTPYIEDSFVFSSRAKMESFVADFLSTRKDLNILEAYAKQV